MSHSWYRHCVFQIPSRPIASLMVVTPRKIKTTIMQVTSGGGIPITIPHIATQLPQHIKSTQPQNSHPIPLSKRLPNPPRRRTRQTSPRHSQPIQKLLQNTCNIPHRIRPISPRIPQHQPPNQHHLQLNLSTPPNQILQASRQSIRKLNRRDQHNQGNQLRITQRQ